MKWADNGGTFEQPEPGSHAAVCYKIIDLGTQENDYQGQKTHKRQVIIGWELSDLMSDGRPFVVSKFYTQSLNEKATLRHDLAGWRGRDFTQEELAGFDARNIIGKPCLLSLTLNDKGKVKIASVAKLPKGMEAPKQTNPSVFLSLEPNDYDQKAFDAQSDKIKAMVMLSPEWQSLQRRSNNDLNDMPDDLPWKDDDVAF
jgi:hypothetical protein